MVIFGLHGNILNDVLCRVVKLRCRVMTSLFHIERLIITYLKSELFKYLSTDTYYSLFRLGW